MRPLLARSDTKRDDAKQRREAIARDGFACCFERWFKSEGWLKCGNSATDTAHIYPRRECGRASSSVIVVLRACRRCHDEFDGHGDGSIFVRVPPDREAAAYKLISMSAKVPVPRRKPPTKPGEQAA